MRKLFLILALLTGTLAANAVDVTEGFTYSKNFWKNSITVSQDINYAMNVGLNFDLAEHDDISHHIYNFSLPIMFRTEGFGFSFRPFILPNNANDASAFGSKLSLIFDLKQDEIENSSASVFASAGFARQDAYAKRTGLAAKKENFDQLTYEGGLVLNYFNVYFFEISGNYFDYLSGVKSLESFGGVLDAQNIAVLDTLDYVLGLPKYSVGGKFKWNSQASQSINTLSYRYIEFTDQDLCPQHSLMFLSAINVMNDLYVNLAYNHIFIQSQKDKNIFKGSITLKF